MRAFITGIAGFIGSRLAAHLLEHGWQVSGIDDMSSGDASNVPHGAVCHLRDMTSFIDDVVSDARPDVVWHCAAAAYEGMSVFMPAFISNNIYAGSANVFSSAIAAGAKRIVFCSSMARYGVGHPPFAETDHPLPVDPYGIAKLAAEDLLRCLGAAHGVEWSIAVPHNVYGPAQNYTDPYRNVAAIMVNRMLQEKQPVIYGDGRQVRCFSYVDDVVPHLAKMGTADAAIRRVINLGPDEGEVTILDLAGRIARKIGMGLHPIFVPDRPCEVREARCSSQLARELLDYETRTDLDTGLGHLIEDIRRRGPKPFRYRFVPELPGAPKTWTEKLL